MPHQRAADHGLEWEDPVLRLRQRPISVTVADRDDEVAEQQERKKNEERREISYPVSSLVIHLMETVAMNKPEKTQEPQPEQLLKQLEAQMFASRQRRAAQESGRSKKGIIGIVIILVGAALALGILMMMLEQMRPQAAEGAGPAGTEAR